MFSVYDKVITNQPILKKVNPSVYSLSLFFKSS